MIEQYTTPPEASEEEAALAIGGEAAVELELTAPQEKAELVPGEDPVMKRVIIPPISEEARDELRAEYNDQVSRTGGLIQGPSGMISIGRKGRGKGGWDDK